jgi:hypothetical protein
MQQIRKRLTYANVMSSIAVFLVLGGASALAATQLGKNTVGSKQLKKNAVTAAKIKKNAVTAAKIKAGAVSGAKLAPGAVGADQLSDGAVTAGKLADGAVGTGKIADGAVTSGKLALGSVGADQLDADQRSEVVYTTSSSSFDFIDEYSPSKWTTVMSLVLPNGSWVVRADLGVAFGGATTHVGCKLVQGETTLAQAGTQGEVVGFAAGLGSIDLAGVASAGQVTVLCGDNANTASAINRSLIATRAGTVTAG